ncbi:MAG: HD domain-containing protein, partial [Candidatus Theseobacter exili]|nr:HD domain-containing protein [Candidatus Theseobacter exili]
GTLAGMGGPLQYRAFELGSLDSAFSRFAAFRGIPRDLATLRLRLAEWIGTNQNASYLERLMYAFRLYKEYENKGKDVLPWHWEVLVEGCGRDQTFGSGTREILDTFIQMQREFPEIGPVFRAYSPRIPDVVNHVRRVAIIADLILKEMDLEPELLMVLRSKMQLAAAAHDLGKGSSEQMIKLVNTAVPFSADAEERKFITEKHPPESLAMLKDLMPEVDKEVQQAVSFHHNPKMVSLGEGKLLTDVLFVADAIDASQDLSRPYMRHKGVTDLDLIVDDIRDRSGKGVVGEQVLGAAQRLLEKKDAEGSVLRKILRSTWNGDLDLFRISVRSEEVIGSIVEDRMIKSLAVARNMSTDDVKEEYRVCLNQIRNMAVLLLVHPYDASRAIERIISDPEGKYKEISSHTMMKRNFGSAGIVGWTLLQIQDILDDKLPGQVSFNPDLAFDTLKHVQAENWIPILLTMDFQYNSPLFEKLLEHFPERMADSANALHQSYPYNESAAIAIYSSYLFFLGNITGDILGRFMAAVDPGFQLTVFYELLEKNLYSFNNGTLPRGRELLMALEQKSPSGLLNLLKTASREESFADKHPKLKGLVAEIAGQVLGEEAPEDITEIIAELETKMEPRMEKEREDRLLRYEPNPPYIVPPGKTYIFQVPEKEEPVVFTEGQPLSEYYRWIVVHAPDSHIRVVDRSKLTEKRKDIFFPDLSARETFPNRQLEKYNGFMVDTARFLQHLIGSTDVKILEAGFIGSRRWGDFGPGSDVDMLIIRDGEGPPGLFLEDEDFSMGFNNFEVKVYSKKDAQRVAQLIEDIWPFDPTSEEGLEAMRKKLDVYSKGTIELAILGYPFRHNKSLVRGAPVELIGPDRNIIDELKQKQERVLARLKADNRHRGLKYVSELARLGYRGNEISEVLMLFLEQPLRGIVPEDMETFEGVELASKRDIRRWLQVLAGGPYAEALEERTNISINDLLTEGKMDMEKILALHVTLKQLRCREIFRLVPEDSINNFIPIAQSMMSDPDLRSEGVLRYLIWTEGNRVQVVKDLYLSDIDDVPEEEWGNRLEELDRIRVDLSGGDGSYILKEIRLEIGKKAWAAENPVVARKGSMVLHSLSRYEYEAFLREHRLGQIRKFKQELLDRGIAIVGIRISLDIFRILLLNPKVIFYGQVLPLILMKFFLYCRHLQLLNFLLTWSCLLRVFP